MRMPDKNAAGAVAIGAVLVAGCPAIGPAAAAELLTGAMLRQNLPGAQININTPLGSVIPVTYGKDGSLYGRAGAVAFFLGSQTDRGKWWIEGSRLCQQWNTWFNGRKNCVRVYHHANNRVEWIDQDGEKGSGTIVALRAAAQTKARPKGRLERRKASNNSASQAVAAARVRRRAQSRQQVAGTPAASRRQRVQASAVSRPDAVPVPAVVPVPMKRARVAAVMPLPKPPVPGKKPDVRPAKVTWNAANVTAAPLGPMARQRIGGASFRVVNVASDDVLNIRNGPSPTTDIVARLPPRATGIMKLGGCSGEWCPIRHGDRAGWVNRYFIAPDGPGMRQAGKRSPNPITYKVVRVAPHDVLNLRRRPDPDSPVVATIPATGKRIRLTGYCVGEWCPIEHARRSGWAHRHYLALEF